MIALGVGVEPGVDPAHLRTAVDAALDTARGAAPGPVEVTVVATHEARAGEAAVLAVAAGRELATYPTAALAAVPVPHPSAVVRRLTGTGSVAEAAAILAARDRGGDGVLVVEKRRGHGVTVALAR